MAVVGVAALALALAYDPSKPSGIAGDTPVWNRSRAEVQAIRFPEMRPVLEAIQARVPANARLGVDLAPLDWEYPLWGPRLGRTLVWLPSRRTRSRQRRASTGSSSAPASTRPRRAGARSTSRP